MSDHELATTATSAGVPTLNEDGIRRSKRRKFHMDFVAAAHGENQKKSKRDYGESSDDEGESEGGGGGANSSYEQQLNVSIVGDHHQGETGASQRTPRGAAVDIPAEEEEEELGRGRRPRRSTTGVFNGYQQETQQNWVEITGIYPCLKCPMRYNNKSSLANHTKMHNGGVLQFACELCDFSATTTKSLNSHVVVHRQYGVLSPQISPNSGAGPGSTSGPSSGPSGPSGGSGGSSTLSSSGPSSTSSEMDNEKASGPHSSTGTVLNTSIESSTSNTSLTGAPQLAVAAEEPFADEPGEEQEEVEDDAPMLQRDAGDSDEDDGPPVLEREVPESPDDHSESSAIRKSGRASKPTQKVLEKKTRGPYKKKIKVLVGDDSEVSSESGQNSPDLLPRRGSMPTSSTSSSVTPPPHSQKRGAQQQQQPSTPPASRESSEEPEERPQKYSSKKKKGRVQCQNCPYSCSSNSRLARHYQGHLQAEGYICPVKGCFFMCRKQGFIAKHYILHGRKLPAPPKYCKKSKRNNTWIVEECEDPMMVGLNLNASQDDDNEEEEEEEMEEIGMEDTVLNSTTDSADSGDVEKVVEDVKPSTSTSSMKSVQKTGPQKRKLEKESPKKQKTTVVVETKKEIVKKTSSEKKQKSQKHVEEEDDEEEEEERQPVSQAELRSQAQIKTHRNVVIDGFHYKQCNVGECEFRTATLTQILAHKIHSHGAMDAFPLHPYLCFTCGYRTRTAQLLRTHKLTAHLTSRRRYHRTFYLKELVGDKFYIRHFTSGRPLLLTAAPSVSAASSTTKAEAPPTLVAEMPQDVETLKAESVETKPSFLMGNVKREIPDEMMMEDDEEEDDDDDEDVEDDKSFDSQPDITNNETTSEEELRNLPPAVRAMMEANEMKFYCDKCPYMAITYSRFRRHYAKHCTENTQTCSRCTWRCRSRNVMAQHERMHAEAEEQQHKAPSTSSSASSSKSMTMTMVKQEEPDVEERMSPDEELDEEPEPPKLFEESSFCQEEDYDGARTTPLLVALQAWCIAEKAKRPELDEPFTRILIDSIKGFQCSDCPYTSKYRGDMRSHKKRHDIEQGFRCVQCTYTTNRPVSLKEHLKQHGVVNRALVAEAKEAPSSLAMPSFLRFQVLRTSQDVLLGTRYGLGKDRIYTCSRCPYVSVALGCLWRHYRNHRDKPRANVCSNCTYSSLDSRKMDEHLLIHLSLGAHDKEQQIPFVKRVDYHGRPVSSMMDLSGEKKTPAKRKLVEKTEDSDEDVEEEEEEIPKTTKRNQRIQKIKEEDKEFRPSPSSSSAPKRRKMSTEPSPEPECSTSSSQHMPTRQLSERATRNRINYSLLSRNGSGKPTPSSSTANLENLVASEIHNQENEIARQADEPNDISHWKIRAALIKEFGTANTSTKCSDCPYKTNDAKVLEYHRYYHTQRANGPRPYVCSDCSFNTFTPTALLQHLKLHSDGFVVDPTMKHQRLQKHQKKGDVIPAGAEALQCRNCPYKTANKRSFQEHVAYHRHLLMNRMMVSLKRQPPKEEYQRPKLKHQTVAKNAKYCRKCTFKCVSQSQFVQHLDRHGWNQLYKCHICDYSDNNQSTVDFHKLTHHVVRDQTLYAINQASKFRLENGKIMKPATAAVPPTPEEFVTKTRGLIKCSFCDYFCHISSELAFHMTVSHLNEPNVEETISHLSMGLIPPHSTVTVVP